MKTTKYLLIALLLSAVYGIRAQNADSTWFWVLPEMDVRITYILPQQDDKVILAGRGLPQIGPSSNAAMDDTAKYIFFTKLNRQQEMLWLNYAWEPKTEHGFEITDLVQDKNGDIHFTGEFQQRIHLGEFVLTADNPQQIKNYYARINSEGVFEHAGIIPFSVYFEEVPSLSVLDDGSIIIHGEDDVEGGIILHTDQNLSVIHSFGFPAADYSYIPLQVAESHDGNLIVSGSFEDMLILGSDTLIAPDGSFNYNSFLSKMTTSGTFLWSKQIKGHYNKTRNNYLSTSEDGNILMWVSFIQYVIPGTDTIYAGDFNDNDLVLGFDDDGNYIWSKKLQSDTGNSYIWNNNIRNVASQGQHYLVAFESSGKFYIDGQAYDYSNKTNLLKIRQDGYLEWVRASGGIISNYIYIDNLKIYNNSYYLAGRFEGLVYFEGQPYYSDSEKHFITKVNDNSWISGGDENNILNDKPAIFPNPATDHIQIKNLPQSTRAIDIYDAGGRHIRSIQHTGTENRFPVKKLKPGLYILKLHTDEGNIFLKFVKGRH